MALFRIEGENREVFGGEKFIRGVRSLYQYSSGRYEEMKHNMKYRFRVRDDGIIYFWGVCSSYSFDPLDFGEQYGCTSIEYKNAVTGAWEVL